MNGLFALVIIFSTRIHKMAKWDISKLDKAIEETAKAGEEPPVPVRTDPKMSYEEKQRRYEKG